MDDRTVERLFDMILLDPLPEFTKEDHRRYVGGQDLDKLNPVRLALATLLMKQYSDSLRERALTKPILVKDGRLILNDCSVHGFNYEEAKVEAKGEMDWHQHDQWACAFGQLSDKFEIAKTALKELNDEVFDWSHTEMCPAWACDANECDCEFKPELLDENGEIPDDHEYSKDDKNHVDCECAKGRMQNRIDAALARLGG